MEADALPEHLNCCEQSVRRTIDAFPIGFLEADRNGALVFINVAAQRLLRKAFSRLKDLNVDDLVRVSVMPPDRAHPMVECLANGRVRTQVEVGLRLPDDELLCLLFSVYPIASRGRRQTGAIALIVDITDRKRMEESLRSAESFLRLSQCVAHIGSWDWDLTSNTVQWSDEMLRIFKLDREALASRPERALEVIHPEDVERVRSHVDQIVQEKKLEPIEFRLVLPDGDVRHVWAKSDLIVNSTEHSTRIIGVVQDISERKRNEDQLRWSKELMRHVLDALPVGVCVIDTGGTIVSANAEGRSLWNAHNIPSLGVNGNVAKWWPNNAPGKSGSASPMREEILSIDRSDGLHKILANATVPIVGDTGQTLGTIFVTRDITEQTRAEQEMRASEQQYRSLMEQASDGIYTMDQSGRFLSVNARGCELLGYSAEQLLTMSLADMLPPGSPPPRLEELRRHGSIITERTIRRGDGGLIEIEVSGTLLADGRIQGIARDITARKTLEAEMRKLSSAVQQTADLVVITDRRGVIEYVNPAFVATTGYAKEEAIGATPRLIKSDKHDAEFHKRLWETVLRGEVFQDVVINRRKNGTLYYEEKSITPIKNESAEITHFVSAGKDITERMRTQERLQYLAHHDVLTGLPNRALFLERLGHAVSRRQWTRRPMAVIFLDLDRFKYVNDTLGHDTGDGALQIAAQRLSSCIRDGDTVARLGGDEFTILLEDLSSANDVPLVARKILDALALPFTVGGAEFFITTSIGITVYPDDAQDALSLLRNADSAMYRAKEVGRNNFQYYSKELGLKAQDRLNMEVRLRRALEREEFALHYQPQVDLVSGRTASYEALLRWNHPELGMVSPLQFISLAEDTGLILPIGTWVLRTACEQVGRWHRASPLPVGVAVNLSARQFAEPGLVQTVQDILDETGIDPRRLELEITENVLMQNVGETIDTLQALAAMGVSLAIDDFGTGYSSLSYLKRFPIARVKIDQSFVRDLASDPDDASIVTAIIAMAHNMDVQVVAEGVETEAQLTFLRSRYCDVAQGFLFGAAQPPQSIVQRHLN